MGDCGTGKHGQKLLHAGPSDPAAGRPGTSYTTSLSRELRACRSRTYLPSVSQAGPSIRGPLYVPVIRRAPALLSLVALGVTRQVAWAKGPCEVDLRGKKGAASGCAGEESESAGPEVGGLHLRPPGIACHRAN